MIYNVKIEIIKLGDKKKYYQADCKDLPGTPPVGYGHTKEMALAALFYLMMYDSSDWLKCIKEGDPIIINGKMWKSPMKCNR